MSEFYMIGPKCEKTDCDCCLMNDRLKGSKESYPPLHDGCDCTVVERKPPSDLMDRPGRFKLNVGVLETDPDVAMKIMARCIIVRAEQLWHERAIEYRAYSLDFEKHELYGSPIPEYVWRLHKDEVVGVNRIG
ncbi:MAG: hypothetical protein KAJ19_20745 [Gammaproteobacteria bacterium]|nr:hypothetical protein [Gammaproteobacteria bacterium]